MLPLPLVLEVRRLLDEGRLSQRAIAARVGVSRGSVGAIASGSRALFGREPAPDDDGRADDYPPVRCPGCGGLVYAPCLLCRSRAYQRRWRRGATAVPRRRRRRTAAPAPRARPTAPPRSGLS